MTTAQPRELFIQGVTDDGRTFRPSDWAERLAGAMSSFRPGGDAGRDAYIGYSPYCVPRVVAGIKCVVVNEALRDIEPRALDFVTQFARDNGLPMAEACMVPSERGAVPGTRPAAISPPAPPQHPRPSGADISDAYLGALEARDPAVARR